METIRPTPVEELRKPHPHQRLIDAASAALLRATAPNALRGPSSASAHAPGIDFQPEPGKAGTDLRD